MSDYKRQFPKPGQRSIARFFFHADALNLSLEATGLAAHIFAFDSDEIDTEFLARMFPDRDLTGPLRELASIGLIEMQDGSTPPAPAQDGPATVGRAGTIYLVEGSGRFKIGIMKSMRARLTSLQTGSPLALRLVHSAFVMDSSAAERLAHGLLARFRLHGEWFECTEERALQVLSTVIDAVGTAPK